MNPKELRQVIELDPEWGDMLLKAGIDLNRVDFLILNFSNKPAEMFVRDHVDSIRYVQQSRNKALAQNGGKRRLPDSKYW